MVFTDYGPTTKAQTGFTPTDGAGSWIFAPWILEKDPRIVAHEIGHNFLGPLHLGGTLMELAGDGTIMSLNDCQKKKAVETLTNPRPVSSVQSSCHEK